MLFRIASLVAHHFSAVFLSTSTELASGSNPGAKRHPFRFFVCVRSLFVFGSRRATRNSQMRSRFAMIRLVAALVLIGAAAFASGQAAHFDGAQTLSLSSCYTPSGFCFGTDIWSVAVDAAGDVAFTGQNPESELSFQAQSAVKYVPTALHWSGARHLSDGGRSVIAQKINASTCTYSGPGSALYLWLASTKTLYQVSGNLGPLSAPTGLAFDPSGNLYVLDASTDGIYKFLGANGSIQVESVYGSGATINGPYAVAQVQGNGCAGGDMAMDGSGNLYYTTTAGNAVEEIQAVNGVIPSSPTTISLGSGFDVPVGIAVDSSGDVYVANAGNNMVQEMIAVNGSIPASPTIRTLGSGFSLPMGLALDSRGDLYVSDNGNNALKKLLAVNGSVPASPSIEVLGDLNKAEAVTLDESGDIFVGNSGANLFELTPSGANVGQVNIGVTAAASPMMFTFDTAGMIGGISVLTQGASGLDYANTGTGTCQANTAYSVGQSCTVDVTFTPKYAGLRMGAVVLMASNGNTVATGYLRGTGVGPQVNFTPGKESGIAVSGNNSAPVAGAIDSAGDLFVVDSRNEIAVEETLSGGGYTQTTIASGLSDPQAVAVDGASGMCISQIWHMSVC